MNEPITLVNENSGGIFSRVDTFKTLRRVAAFGIMLTVGMLCRTEYLSDWDSWDYVILAIQGHSSRLSLGRWWFIVVMRWVHLFGKWVLGLGQLDSCLAMQWVCAAMTAGGIVAGMAWVWAITKNAAAEMVFALLIITAPMVGVMASSVMTESMTFLMLMLAMWAWEVTVKSARRRKFHALLAGVCFGIAVSIREPLIIAGILPFLSCWIDKPAGRWKLFAIAMGGMVLALGGAMVGAWAWFPPDPPGYFGHFSQWYNCMADGAARANYSPAKGVSLFVQYAFVAAPALFCLLPLALVWTFFFNKRLLPIFIAVGIYSAATMCNYGLDGQPRFILPAIWLTAAAAGVSVGQFSERRGKFAWATFSIAAVLILVISAKVVHAAWPFYYHHHYKHADTRLKIYRVLLQLPDDAMVIPGQGSIAASYLLELKEKNFAIISDGWAWPHGKVPQKIADAFAQGRRVFIATNTGDWAGKLAPGDEYDQLIKATKKYKIIPAIGPMAELIQKAR